MAQRRNNRRGPRRPSQQGSEERSMKEPEWETPCPICGNKILEISSAITDRITGDPAHFECIMKKIAEEEEIGPDERVCYLGNGSFGIIQQRNTNQMKFFIRKRIQYEDKETVKEWRRGLVRTNVTPQKSRNRKRNQPKDRN